MKIPTLEIVVPVHERDKERLAILQTSLAYYVDLRLRLYNESTLLHMRVIDQADEAPYVGDFVGSGWYKQQVIKLVAVATSAADFCLVLDADCFATQPITAARLFTATGRALMPRLFSSAHAVWYKNAVALLGVAPDMLPNEFHQAAYTSVTPLVLAPVIARKTLHMLEREGYPWRSVLTNATASDLKWSEYSLYYVAAWASGLWNQYHASGPMLAGDCVWNVDDVAMWKPRFDRDASHLFSLVQSNTGLSAQWVRDCLKEHGAPFL